MPLPKIATLSLVIFLLFTPLTLTGIDRYVTSAADSGAGTLREALDNVVAGESITFDPTVFSPTAQQRISLTTKFTNMAVANVTIDATGLWRGAKAGVTVDGSGIGNTNHEIILFNNATGQHVYGIRFTNGRQHTVQVNSNGGRMTFKWCTFDSAEDSHGMNDQAGNGTQVYLGCHFGTDSDGTAGMGNPQSGIRCAGAASYIFGSNTDRRDVCVFGNNGQYNLRIDDCGNTFVSGNYIGTNQSLADLGAPEYGTSISNAFDDIAYFYGNTMGYNTLAQVRITAASGSTVRFENNYIGVSHDGISWQDIGDGSGTGILGQP